MKQYNKRLLPIFLLWGLIYLIYPSWLWPIPAMQRYAVISFFTLYLVLNAILCLRWAAHLEAVSPTAVVAMASPSPWRSPWLVFALISVLLHLYPMQFPIRDDDDEAYHAANALTLKEKVEDITQKVSSKLPFPSWRQGRLWLGGGSLLVALGLLWKKLKGISKQIFSAGVGMTMLLLLWRFLVNEPYLPGLLLHPPLAKLLNLGAYTVLGVSEFNLRILSLIFSVFASLLVFKMTVLYRSEDVALISALMTLFLPNCFYYAGVAELASGTLFFMVLVAYLGLVSLRTEASSGPFFWFIVAGGAAFFYHRMTVLMLGILLVFYFWIYLGRTYALSTLRRWLVATYFASVPILLWLLICHFLVYRNYDFTPSNWLHSNLLLRYFWQIPTQMGYFLFGLFLIGLLRALLRKKDPLVILCLVWFFLAYLFLSGDGTTARLRLGVSRYGLILYPPITILTADLLGGAIQKMGILGRRSLLGILLGYLLLSSTFISIPPVEARYTTFWQKPHSTYAIYDAALPFMMETLPPSARIFDTKGSDYFKFYLKKYRSPFVWNKEEAEAALFEPRALGQDHLLYQRCREGRFGYVFCESETLSQERFRLIKVFDSDTKRRYLWRVLQ